MGMMPRTVMNPLFKHLREITEDSVRVTLTLFKILIPAVIIVRLLELIGAADFLANTLSTPMEWLGLPAVAGIVWATTLLTNIYAGLIVLFTYSQVWTLEQITLMGILMLGAHNLIVEIAITYRGGCRLLPMMLIRIGGALGLAICMHWVYQDIPSMQQPVSFDFAPELSDNSWASWVKAQLEMLFWTVVVIVGLVAVLRVAKVTGLERAIEYLLRPILKLIGIKREALPMSLIGMTLGLAYGGGLLIREAEKGTISGRDIFASFALLGLCHSLIEDTLLIALTGAELHGILWARLAFALIIIALLTRLLPLLSDQAFYRFLMRKT